MVTKRDKKRLYNYKYEYNYLYVWYKYHYHFFHSLINSGKKLQAFKFFINIKYNLKQSEQLDPLLIFFLAINNIIPEILLFPLKLGGIVNEVGLPITRRKQIIFTTKWIIKLLKDKFDIINVENISNLLLESIRNRGISVKKKEKTQLIAIRNRYLIKYFK